MKRFHVHVRVKNLEESIAFYNALFNTKPSLSKPDYAKWMLEDPRINYAISTGHSEIGIEHLGLQVESEIELQEVYQNMEEAKGLLREEGECINARPAPEEMEQWTGNDAKNVEREEAPEILVESSCGKESCEK